MARTLSLVLWIAAALPARASEGPWSLWIQPVPVVMAIAALPEGLHLSLGGSRAVTNSFGAGLELALSFARDPSCRGVPTFNGCRDSLTAVSLVPGLRYHLFQSSRGSGFFFQPKLLLGWVRETGTPHGRGSDMGFHPREAFDIGVGMDVGYQLRLGPVLIEPVVGIAVGHSTRGESAVHQPLLNIGIPNAAHNESKEYVAPNFNVLRLGVTF